MRDSIEEEEVGGLDCHDKHDPTCYHDGEERDDVENSEDVQDDVAWATIGIGAGAEVDHLECDVGLWFIS